MRKFFIELRKIFYVYMRYFQNNNSVLIDSNNSAETY